MDDYSAARSRVIPPLPWQTFAPPFPLRLAFLAPELQRAILKGTQPRDLTLARLTDGAMPLCWHEQRRRLGVERPAQLR